MKVLVTGALGLLGQRLIEMTPSPIEVLGVDLADHQDLFPRDAYQSCDLADRPLVRELVESFKPDWILNCAAYTNVDGAEEQRKVCWRANVEVVENLVYAARKVDARIVQVSTDYIFDGKHGPYDENEIPNPLGYYGRSKLAAENVLKSSPVDFAVARTMVLYGVSRNQRPDFVGWLVGQLGGGKPVRIVTDQIGNTTLNDDLAAGMWTIVDKGFQGVVNVAGREIAGRYDFALKIAELFDLDASLISPIETHELNQKAPRPLNSGLIVEKATQLLDMKLSNMEEGIRKYQARLHA